MTEMSLICLNNNNYKKLNGIWIMLAGVCFHIWMPSGPHQRKRALWYNEKHINIIKNLLIQLKIHIWFIGQVMASYKKKRVSFLSEWQAASHGVIVFCAFVSL